LTYSENPLPTLLTGERTARGHDRPNHEDNLNDARAPILLPRKIATLSHTALVVKKQRPVPRPEMGRWPIAVLHCPVARVSGSGVGSALRLLGEYVEDVRNRTEDNFQSVFAGGRCIARRDPG
jgi:hypothetical protein